MALGDFTVKGKAKFEGTAELAGGAKDTTLITNLNADLLDNAHKDTDGTLSGNSDSSIPTEKAVKTYADARKAECVQLTGAQTIGGPKTFSDIPLFPANTIETADLQNGAVTEDKIVAGAVTLGKIGASAVVESNINNYAVTASKIGSYAVSQVKINKAFGSGGTVNFSPSDTWVPPAGLYMWVGTSQSQWELDIYQGGAWRSSGGAVNGGFIYTDGSSVRIKNASTSTAILYYLDMA